MIDLTQYLTRTERLRVGPLFSSDAASVEIGKFLRTHSANEYSRPDQFGAVVAKSVANFLTSDYFGRSTWFRSERVHTVCVCVVNTSAGPVVPVLHVAKLPSRGYMIATAVEEPVTAAYCEQRLIEEVRVEEGIPGEPVWRTFR